MRFMMFMISDITEEEWAPGPDVEMVSAMSKFNEELTQAGVLRSSAPRGRVRPPRSRGPG
jgi:hypothetical protein